MYFKHVILSIEANSKHVISLDFASSCVTVLPISRCMRSNTRLTVCFLKLSKFYRRQRAAKDGYSSYEVDLSGGQISSNSDKVTFGVVNPNGGHRFVLDVIAYEDGVFRVKMNEEAPLHPRFEVPHVILPELKTIA